MDNQNIKEKLTWQGLKLDYKSEKQTNNLTADLNRMAKGWCVAESELSADKVDFQATGCYWFKGGIQMGNTAPDYQK